MTTALLVPLFPFIPSSLASSYAPHKSPAILPILLISLCSTDGSLIIEMIWYDFPCLPDPPLAKVADLLPHLNHLGILDLIICTFYRVLQIYYTLS